MSATLPRWPSGIAASIPAMYSAPMSSRPSVAMLPGMIALTVIFCLASSSAADFRKPSWPALLAP